MPETKCVPTLGLGGWVYDKAQKADYLISHFYEADKAQTHLYGKNVTSLQWLVEEYGSNIVNFTQQLRTALEIYLSRYYDAVLVEITNNDNATNLDGRVTFSIFCKVTEAGVDYSFGKLLQVMDSNIVKIMNLNNNDTAN